jgi:hypothetical protein
MRRNSSMSSLIKCILFLVFYVQAALYGSAGNSDDSARTGASNIGTINGSLIVSLAIRSINKPRGEF